MRFAEYGTYSRNMLSVFADYTSYSQIVQRRRSMQLTQQLLLLLLWYLSGSIHCDGRFAYSKISRKFFFQKNLAKFSFTWSLPTFRVAAVRLLMFACWCSLADVHFLMFANIEIRYCWCSLQILPEFSLLTPIITSVICGVLIVYSTIA
jgi:hypothetical protein